MTPEPKIEEKQPTVAETSQTFPKESIMVGTARPVLVSQVQTMETTKEVSQESNSPKGSIESPKDGSRQEAVPGLDFFRAKEAGQKARLTTMPSKNVAGRGFDFGAVGTEPDKGNDTESSKSGQMQMAANDGDSDASSVVGG